MIELNLVLLNNPFCPSSQSVPGDVPLASSSQGHKVPTQKVPRGETAAALQFNSEYIQRIRQGLEEDALERQEREKRRRTFLIEQLKAHEAQEVKDLDLTFPL